MIEKNLTYNFIKINNENSADFSRIFSEGVDSFNTLRIYNSKLDLRDLTIFREVNSLMLSNVKISNLFVPEISFFNNLRYLELDGEDAISLLNKYSFDKVSQLYLSNSSYLKCHLQSSKFIKELVIKFIEKLELVSFPSNLNALTISNCDLKDINENVFSELSLEYLELSFLKLKKIPNIIFNFEKLEKLSLSGNFIKLISKELSRLKLLRELSLTNMEIDTFDYEFYKSLALFRLRLDETSISLFPKEFELEQIYLFISLLNTQINNYSEEEFNLLVNEYMHDGD